MKLTSRLAIAMIALVALAVTAVGWLSYHNVELALVPRMLDRIEKHAQLVASELQSYTGGARADVASFRAAAAAEGFIAAHLNGGIDPADHVAEAVWRDRLTRRLVAELGAKPAYAQFRLIGIENGQRELIRVDRSGPDGAIRVVPDAELQPKGDRSYFTETLKLAADGIYVSPLDLNMENGVIETPHAPTLRVATPVFSANGRPFGIFVINIDMRPAFDHVRAATPRGGMIYAVNARGEYLLHPDSNREFGLQLNRPADWPKDFPVLAPALGASQVASHIVPDQDGARGGMTLAPAVLAGQEWVGIIETVSNAVIMSPAKTIQHTTLAVGLVAVLCAAILAVLIARSLTRPIAQLTSAVEGLGQGKPAAIPVDAGGETGVLARAFARMMNEASSKTLALEREVSEHRRTEVARDHHAERERLFSAAVESSSDAIIIKEMDGTIIGWNPAAERLYGYTALEAVGRHVSLIIPPERLPEEEDANQRIARGERIEQNETVRLHKDGTPVEVSLSMAPIRSASGAVIGVTKSARDITERNRTLRAIQQQAEELRRIFETSQDLILVMDPKGRVNQVSPSCEAILGYRPEAVIGRGGDEFVHVESLEVFREQLRHGRRGQRMKIPDAPSVAT